MQIIIYIYSAIVVTRMSNSTYYIYIYICVVKISTNSLYSFGVLTYCCY